MPRAVWDDVARGRFAHPGHRMLGALRAAVARAEATGDVALLAEKRAQVNEYFEAQRVSVLGASDIAPVATLPAAHIALVKEAGEAQLAMATAHASNFAAPYLEAAAREVADVEMTARRARASLLNALAMLGGRTAPMQAVR